MVGSELLFEPVADERHRLDVVAVKAQLAAQRQHVMAERLFRHAVAIGTDGLGDPAVRQRLVGPAGQESQNPVLDRRQPQRSLATFGLVRPGIDSLVGSLKAATAGWPVA